ncbi:MAG: hypothetical protein ACREM1_15855 [Longimicrobiales bacterium]
MNAHADLCARLATVPIVAAVAPSLAAGQRQEPVTLGAAERLQGLSIVWMEARYNFPFFDQVPELDWDAAYREFIPQVLEEQTLPEYYRTLQRFAALLRDGHTRVTGPWGFDTYPDWDEPWILLRPVGRRVLIENVGRSTAGPLSPGDELVAVDGVPLAEHLEANILPLVSASTESDR